MKSKWFVIVSVVALVGIMLTACGPKATEAPVSNEVPEPQATEAVVATEPPAGNEGEVAIVAWPGYIERGATDPAYDWVTAFEQETGCKVTVKDAATSDEMVQLMNSGGFDLVTASGDASLRLVYGGTVQAIDITKVPSYGTVDERLQNAPCHNTGKRKRQKHRTECLCGRGAQITGGFDQ